MIMQQCWIIVTRLFLLFICFFGTLCYSQEVGSFLDSETLLAIEIDDVSELVSRFANSDFATHEQWENLNSYLTHPRYGVLNLEQLESIASTKDSLLSELSPKQLVFSVEQNNLRQWQCIVKCDGPDPESTMRQLIDTLKSLLSPDSEQSSKDFPDDKQIRMPAEPGDPHYESIFDWTFCWLVHDQLVLMTNDEKGLEKLARRVKGVDDSFRSLQESRIYRTISSVLKSSRQSSRQSSSLRIHIDPELVWPFVGLDDESVRCSWGLDEVSAAGIAVHFCASQTDPEHSTEVVVDCFVKITEPRDGIFSAIKLLGEPDEVPYTPPDTIFFWLANMDWKKFENERNRLYDEAYGIGSYEKMLANQGQSSGAWYRKEQARCLGGVVGKSWCKIDGRTVGLDFKEVTDSDKMADLIVSTTRENSQRPDFKYEKTEFNGYPAVLAQIVKQSGTKRNVGAIFKDGWVFFGIDAVLSKVCEVGQQQNALPGEVKKMVKDLRLYIKPRGEMSALAAIFPEYIDRQRYEWAIDYTWNRITIELKERRLSIEDRLKARKEALASLKSYDFSEPKSHEECVQNISMIFAKIVSDSFSKWVFIGSDEGSGFRVCGKSFGPD